MCMADLLSILIHSTRLAAVSRHVNALNSTNLPWSLTSQGQIRSMATSSQGATRTSLLGNSPYPRSGILYFWQSGHLSVQCVDAMMGGSIIVSTILLNAFLQDAPWLGETTWQFQPTLIWAGQSSNCHEWDPSCNRWCCQHRHPVASWHNCLGILLVELAVFYPAAADHGCEVNSMDYDQDVAFQGDRGSTQAPVISHHHWVL